MFYQADSGTKQWYELQAGASTVSFGFGLFFSFPILAAWKIRICIFFLGLLIHLLAPFSSPYSAPASVMVRIIICDHNCCGSSRAFLGGKWCGENRGRWHSSVFSSPDDENHLFSPFKHVQMTLHCHLPVPTHMASVQTGRLHYCIIIGFAFEFLKNESRPLCECARIFLVVGHCIRELFQ